MEAFILIVVVTSSKECGMEELYEDPTVGPLPKVWNRGQKCKK